VSRASPVRGDDNEVAVIANVKERGRPHRAGPTAARLEHEDVGLPDSRTDAAAAEPQETTVHATRQAH